MSNRSQADLAGMCGEGQVLDLKVLVVGEALIDLVETGGDLVEHVGGSPANVALGLGRRGVNVSLLSQIGRDARGRIIIDHLEASGVTVLSDSISSAPTSTACARIGSHGQATYEFDIDWGAVRLPSDGAPRLVHTGSVAAFLEPGASSVRRLLRDGSATDVTFDPNIRPALVGVRGDALAAYEATARLATVVKMSDEDASWLYPGASIDQVVDAVLDLGPALVAITLGEQGAVIANAEHRVSIPAAPVVAVDTIGAGDTFMASLIHSVLEHGSRGLDRQALQCVGHDAVRAAAITVARAGADLPWASELRRAIRADT